MAKPLYGRSGQQLSVLGLAFLSRNEDWHTGKTRTRNIYVISSSVPNAVDAEDNAFTKTHNSKRIYSRRKETIEHSLAEAKGNHDLRFARIPGIQNMREQCLLTASVQNIKRVVKAA